MTKKKTNISPAAAYEQFVKGLEFSNIRLISSSSKFDIKADEVIHSQRDQSVATMLLSSEYILGKIGEGFFEAIGDFRLEMQGQKTKVKPVIVECKFEAHFHVESVSKTLAKRFTEQDFRLVLWSYFREFVQSITSRMAIRPIIIPLGIQE